MSLKVYYYIIIIIIIIIIYYYYNLIKRRLKAIEHLCKIPLKGVLHWTRYELEALAGSEALLCNSHCLSYGTAAHHYQIDKRFILNEQVRQEETTDYTMLLRLILVEINNAITVAKALQAAPWSAVPSALLVLLKSNYR